MSWAVWDEATGRRASVASYDTREQVERQIAHYRERQAKGKRPDVDASRLVAREVP